MKTIRNFLKLATPFWFNRHQWREWILLVAVVGFALAIIRVSVWMTAWNKTFYDALAAFNGAVMPELIGQFLGFMALIVAFIACGNWLKKWLIFRWREHLNQQFQSDWLNQHQHYYLKINGPSEPDNPDQRIAEDILMLSEKSIDLFKYFLMNVAKLGAFVSVLWTLSGAQTFSFLGVNWTFDGYLVWVALIYSILSTGVMHWIGHRLQNLNVERQHREADFRTALLRVRDHSEQIAIYQGEKQEIQRLNRRFSRIKSNWFQLMAREFKLEIFSASYLRLSMFIPIFATLPMYLAKSMTFGDMMQARSAFGNVQDGFGWLMDYYKRLIEWAAVVERLSQFQAALHEKPNFPETYSHQQNSNYSLSIKNLTIRTANGRNLLKNIECEVNEREWVLLDGKSGLGKSTFLRTLAGLHPYYCGEIFRLPENSCLFFPQKPYLPSDNLRTVISYPNEPIADNEKLQWALECVGLVQLAEHLHDEREYDWQQHLSGGEQQRLSLARALLQRPQQLFLDEATNQLDDDSALELMKILKQNLPESSCLGISHQTNIKAWFERKIDLTEFAK